ncbi:hypothetical protein U1707_03590 [Sphingomonas sp. PB2P12]|uniref:hypothetical protein n=1 Tax=Sphingomonas sandaracina TaxID=3096157 RepID=UPI002FCBA047
MSIGLIKILVLLACSMFYWHLVCRVTGTQEPWDADTYWRVWYPVSLGLAAFAGLFFQRRGWMAGAILTFAQLPVMWLNTGAGNIWVTGIVMSCVLALPVAAISAMAGWLAVRRRSA